MIKNFIGDITHSCNIFGLLVLTLLLLTYSPLAHASGGTGEYTLDWPVRGELLAYHSSGCADACWVAEVRKKSTHQVRARLRCDGDQLYFSQAGKSREQLLQEGCANYNDSNDKLQLITDKVMVLLRGQQSPAKR